MKHTKTRALYEYWNKQRGVNRAPLRTDIHPNDIKWLLPGMFILEYKDRSEFPFTLAGTHLCDYYAMELRGLNMCNFWHGPERASFIHVLQGVVDEGSVGVIGFKAHTNLKNVEIMEMVVMPLRSPPGRPMRILGCLSPFNVPVWMGKEGEKITHHEISSLRMFAPGKDTYSQPLSIRTADKPLETTDISGTPFTAIKHLRVIEGGRRD